LAGICNGQMRLRFLAFCIGKWTEFIAISLEKFILELNPKLG